MPSEARVVDAALRDKMNFYEPGKTVVADHYDEAEAKKRHLRELRAKASRAYRSRQPKRANTGKCEVCGKPLTGKRTRYHSIKCKNLANRAPGLVAVQKAIRDAESRGAIAVRLSKARPPTRIGDDIPVSVCYIRDDLDQELAKIAALMSYRKPRKRRPARGPAKPGRP